MEMNDRISKQLHNVFIKAFVPLLEIKGGFNKEYPFEPFNVEWITKRCDLGTSEIAKVAIENLCNVTAIDYVSSIDYDSIIYKRVTFPIFKKYLLEDIKIFVNNRN